MCCFYTKAAQKADILIKAFFTHIKNKKTSIMEELKFTESECWGLARKDLRGRWLEAALLTFVYVLVSCLISATVGSGLNLICPGFSLIVALLLMPMGWGWSMTFLECHRSDKDPFKDPFNVKNLFVAYNKDFSRIFTTLFLQFLYKHLQHRGLGCRQLLGGRYGNQRRRVARAGSRPLLLWL